jgi:hypothetical protein
MDEDDTPVTGNLSPRQQEDAVLEFFKANFTTNPKKVKRMALKMWGSQPAFIQKGMLENILAAHDPVKMLLEFFSLMDEWKSVIPDLLAAGYHGLILNGATIHGFNLKTQVNWLKEEDRWCLEQEADIQNQVIKTWMEERGLKRFHGKILMFDEFGFSGVAREVQIRVP